MVVSKISIMARGSNTQKICNYGARNPERSGIINKLVYFLDPCASCDKYAEIIDGKNPLFCEEHGCPECFCEVEGKVKVGDF